MMSEYFKTNLICKEEIGIGIINTSAIQEKKTLVVNLLSGPGVGKSTCMAGVFSELKLRGVNCEQAPEFAKEKVWEGSWDVLSNQIYVFGKQLHAIHRLIGKVDVIVTDSPILLSIIYGKNEGQKFRDLVLEVHNRFDNFNVFLRRLKKYNPSGRLQTEDEAKEKDDQIRALLNQNNLKYLELMSGRETILTIADYVMEKIGNQKGQFV